MVMLEVDADESESRINHPMGRHSGWRVNGSTQASNIEKGHTPAHDGKKKNSSIDDRYTYPAGRKGKRILELEFDNLLPYYGLE